MPAPALPRVAADRRRILGARAAWLNTARAEQVTPPGDWRTWLLLAGRGFGKTRVEVEDGAKYGVERPGSRIACVAATTQDARMVMLEGESGLLSVLHRYGVIAPNGYNRVEGTVRLTNGSLFLSYSAEKPDRLRGPQHHRALCDELAAWRYPEAWDMLQFGLRLGTDPRAVVATTPRPTRLVRELLRDPTTHVTRGSTFANAANLAPTFLEQVRAKYEGTRLGRQELLGEVLEDVEGALWTLAMFETPFFRLTPDALPDLQRVVVAVDPATTSGESSDATGIAVAGRDYGWTQSTATVSPLRPGDPRPHGYLLHSEALRDLPEVTMRRVAELYHAHHADAVVIEANQGGDYLPAVLRQVDRTIPVRMVHARRGKHTRAEPVSALYEQARVHHVGQHAALEEQLTTWTDAPGEPSPDLLDALVWAFTDLLVADHQAVSAPSRDRRLAGRR